VKRESGFTLLEVLVTLTILAVGAVLTLSLISASLGNIRKVRLRTRAVEHARQVMELALVDDAIAGPSTLAGDYEDGTRWSVVIGEMQMPVPATVMQNVQMTQLPFKVLSYAVEVTEPNSTTPVFQLQTLKLVSVPVTAAQGRGPR
jgi:prepilin-type N-terminal cleavage/methylation domain-containing protein